jgi:hypothetical protein
MVGGRLDKEGEMLDFPKRMNFEKKNGEQLNLRNGF